MRKLLFFILIFTASLQAEEKQLSRSNMSGHVFVVSEWLPKENCEEELWKHFKKLMALTLENESGCIRAHATRQIAHPGAPGKTQYTIVLLQEYVDLHAFDIHCKSDYVANYFKKYLEDEETSLVKEWRCRLFSEED